MFFIRIKRYLCIFVIFFGFSLNLKAQSLTVPPNESNTRFSSQDVFASEIVRPALSIRGFDSSTLPGGTNHGYGLKQILEEYLSEDERYVDIFEENIIPEADMDLVTPTGSLKDKRQDLNKNSRITQSRAFVALATYILEENGYGAESQSAFGKSHGQALQELNDALLNPPGGNHMALDLVTDDNSTKLQNAKNIAIDALNDGLDPVKFNTSLANIARAIDLYLALENAYDHYGDSMTALLSEQERNDFLSHYGKNLKAFYKFNILSLNDVNDYLNNQGVYGNLLAAIADVVASIADLSLEELQPGNWPFKNFLAIGYASLGMHVPSSANTPYKNYFHRAYDSAFQFATQNRKKYWSYQTDNGKNFWAEGPYYLHFTLREVIPFWHAVRGNGFYNSSNGQISYNGLSVDDPFNNSDFTAPLNWLADIVTPDGRIPPIDDGNKAEMNKSSILRWTSGYGDTSVGNKFAAINEKVGSFGSSSNLYLVELSIPRQPTGGSIPSGQASDLTNDQGNDHQLVTRRGSGSNMHYVLLNGEGGDADNRGEGHEQPDQLQLLYYKGDTSYLMDTGYDEGGIQKNSSWNNYKFHNNIAYPHSQNIFPPYNGWSAQITDKKARKVYDNHPVFDFNMTSSGNVQILEGSTNLKEWLDFLHDGALLRRFAIYDRKVLMTAKYFL
jgi:hypothetical protein